MFHVLVVFTSVKPAEIHSVFHVLVVFTSVKPAENQLRVSCACCFSVADLQLLVDTEKAEKEMLADQLSATEVHVYNL